MSLPLFKRWRKSRASPISSLLCFTYSDNHAQICKQLYIDTSRLPQFRMFRGTEKSSSYLFISERQLFFGTIDIIEPLLLIDCIPSSICAHGHSICQGRRSISVDGQQTDTEGTFNYSHWRSSIIQLPTCVPLQLQYSRGRPSHSVPCCRLSSWHWDHEKTPQLEMQSPWHSVKVLCAQQAHERLKER